MRRSILGCVIAMFCTAAMSQQQAATEATLRGKWIVPEARSPDAFTFNAGQEFVGKYTFIKKDGKQSETISRQLEGAYSVGPNACSAGQEKGNLWVVQGSERCCFTAYHMGKTLVLDEVRGGVVYTMPLCSSRTLKRPS